MRHVHLIVLQHGYHGTSADLQQLDRLLRSATAFTAEALPSFQCLDTDGSVAFDASAGASSSVLPTAAAVASSGTRPSPALSPPFLETVVLNVNANDGWRTDQGVLACADRLTTAVMAEVRAHVAPSVRHDVVDTAAARIALHFSFVAHSMGGLIVRAALPELARQASALTDEAAPSPSSSSSSPSPVASITWETFCCVSVPHVGVTHMPSSLRASMGKLAGHIFSKGLHDLFLSSPVVAETITSEAHLKAWKGFHRRILMNTANDRTVMSYSSILTILPEEQTILTSQHKHVKNATSTTAASTSVHPAAPDGEQAYSPTRSEAMSLPVVRTLDHIPPAATNESELARSGWTLDAVTDSLWPPQLLPRERALATRLASDVGPFEIYTVDFRPAYAELVASTALPPSTRSPGSILPEVAAQPAREKALMAIARRGVEDWAHRAVVCKGEYAELPSFFGFVSQYIASTVFGGATASQPQTTEAQLTVSPKRSSPTTLQPAE